MVQTELSPYGFSCCSDACKANRMHRVWWAMNKQAWIPHEIFQGPNFVEGKQSVLAQGNNSAGGGQTKRTVSCNNGTLFLYYCANIPPVCDIMANYCTIL